MKTIQTQHDFFDNELEIMRLEKKRLYQVAQYSEEAIGSIEKWHERISKSL